MHLCFDLCLAARCAHFCFKPRAANAFLFPRKAKIPALHIVVVLCLLVMFLILCLAIKRRAGRHTTTLEVQRCRMTVSAVQTAALGHHGGDLARFLKEG